jgi:DNA-binding transcriptional MerR regulator
MFTVRQLSRIAGITPRTLHYYDEIGLLKPSQVGENGYRYYGDECLLLLQQILFYRELDIPLKEIKEIISRADFEVLSALESHKARLNQRVRYLENLITTVDDTLYHLKGKKEMSQKQLFDAFNDEQQAEYEQEALQMYDPAIVQASMKKWKSYTADDKRRIQDEGNAVYQDILNAMPDGPSSPKAQAGVARWHQHMQYFWSPNDDQLIGLAEGYNNDPRFKSNFDKIDPNLAEFMRQAVKVYVDNRKV